MASHQASRQTLESTPSLQTPAVKKRQQRSGGNEPRGSNHACTRGGSWSAVTALIAKTCDGVSS